MGRSRVPEDEHVRVAFFPVRDPKPEIKTAFGNAKSWLRFAAQECGQARVNHAFKHGISVRAGEAFITLELTRQVNEALAKEGLKAPIRVKGKVPEDRFVEVLVAEARKMASQSFQSGSEVQV